MGGNRIEIVCGIDSKFIIPCGVMLTSLMESNIDSSFSFHIVYNLEETLPDFAYLLKKIQGSGHSFTLYKVDESKLKGLPLSIHASTANYFRLLFSELLPVSLSKVLYFDSDLVFIGAIEDLWETDISNYLVAAVEQQGYDHSYLGIAPSSPYFNSGVMLLNLDAWRNNQVSTKALDFVRKNEAKIRFWDQDVFNVLFEGRWLKIDPIWNHLGANEMGKSKVVHFAGKHKPWDACCNHPYKALYFKYLKMYLNLYSYFKYVARHFGYKILFKQFLLKGN